MSNKIKNIILHCSASTWGLARDIRKWHMDKGWRDGGYHFVISNGNIKSDFYLKAMDGSIEGLRVLDGDNYITGKEVGAHALGYNGASIGICLIGINDFTGPQQHALVGLLAELMERFDIPVEGVLGHYETPMANGKTCPNIDMEAYRKNLSYWITQL